MKIGNLDVEVTSHRCAGGWISRGTLPNGKLLISGPKINREEAEHDVEQQAKAHLHPQHRYDVNRPFESLDDDDDYFSFSDVEDQSNYTQQELNLGPKIFLDSNPEGGMGMSYEISNDVDDRTVFVQTDWDFPPTASAFGWSTAHTPRGSTLDFNPEVDTECPGSDGTDGTEACPYCGKDVGEFIGEASQWLDDHDGASAIDPGYFMNESAQNLFSLENLCRHPNLSPVDEAVVKHRADQLLDAPFSRTLSKSKRIKSLPRPKAEFYPSDGGSAGGGGGISST